jgi:hypothetical protein
MDGTVSLKLLVTILPALDRRVWAVLGEDSMVLP